MRKRNLLSTFLLVLCAGTFNFINAQVVLVENFDGGVNGWTGTFFTTTSQACTGSSPRDNIFTTAGGDFLSPNQVAASNGTDISVSFDYKIVDYSAATNPTPAGWGTSSFEFSVDAGTTWSSALLIDDSNHVTSAVCSTVVLTILGADVPLGSDVQFRLINTWSAGDYYFYFDEFSATQVITDPPNCDAALTSATTDFPIDGNLTWSNATGGPDGYFLNIGTTMGGTDVINNLDVGSVTSYDLTPSGLAFSTTYYVTIIPYNGNGSASGCVEESFVTEPDPNNIVPITCGTPINTTHCYSSLDATTWTFSSSDGISPLILTFNAGTMEGCCDDIIIYEGTDDTGTVLYSGNNGGDLTGLIVTSTGASIFMTIDSDGSVQCDGSTTYTAWDWDADCLTCETPMATFTAVDACPDGFNVEVNITDLGNAVTVEITDGTDTLASMAGLGLTVVGPFTNAVDITLAHDSDNACDLTELGLELPACPIEVTCGTTTNTTYCYTADDASTFTYSASDGISPLVLNFNAGTIEDCCDDIFIYDGADNTGTLLFSGANGGDLTGLTVIAASGSLFLEVDSDGSVQCDGSTSYVEWDWDINCLTCETPTATFTAVDACPAGFNVEVNITDLGDATSYDISDGTNVLATGVGMGITTVGPFASGVPVDITLVHDTDNVCDTTAIGLVLECPLTCGSLFTDSGGATGDYSNNENETWTICPTVAGEVVSLTFSVFETEGFGATSCWDEMYIYNGMDATTPLMSPSAGHCWQSATDGTEYPGGALGVPITSTDPSGCLYVTFSSDGSGTFPGWEAMVTCGLPAADCGSTAVTLAGSSFLANVPNCQIGTWTYYGDGAGNYFAMEKYPVGGNTAFFEPVVDVNVDAAATSVDDGTSQTNTSQRYWNVDLTRGVLNADVNIRFYYDPAENMALEATSMAWAGPNGIDFGLEWFKTQGANFDPATDVTATGVNTGITLVPTSMGMENGIDFVEFAVSSFSGGGATSSARNSPLPIELVSFSGQVAEKENILNWEVAQEINVSHYEVLRSLNGMDRWETIGTTSAFGNSNDLLNYTIKDQQPKVKAYYRLLSVDFDGKTQLSDRIVLERLDNKFKLHDIYPTPTKDVVNLQFETKSDAEVNFIMTDVSGKVLMQRSIEVGKGLQNETINLNDFPAGLYFLQIENDGDRIVERIIKN